MHAPGVDVLPVEEQPFVVVGLPGDGFADGIVASGSATIVAEVAHRTSTLPLVLQGVGLAILPSAWVPLARRAGAAVVPLDPPAYLHVALLSRSAPLTPAAREFLAAARTYRPNEYLSGPSTAKIAESYDPDR